MKINVAKELAALKKMSVGELRERYEQVWGEPTNSRHREWLIKRTIWRMQALAEGDLSERARQRAAELANDADLRRRPPRVERVPAKVESRVRTIKLNGSRLPPAGNVITRVYKGETLEVLVREDGFEYSGDWYKSLSAVAKRVTGSHCNGYLFFRLNGGQS
jgi:hypothetical protein